jgi:RNA polymerase sigma-70 factor (ECF subfamily)
MDTMHGLIEPDEVELAAALAAGDPAALERVYSLYAPLAVALATRMLGDRRSAEEAVQDAFVVVWRHAAEFAPERGSLRAWLLRIVRYRCIDRLRSGASQPPTVTWEPGRHDTRTTADPVEEIERQDEGDTVRKAVQSLPPAQREVIELAYFHERSHSEIADRLGIPLGTVKGRVRLAMSRLRQPSLLTNL